MSASVRDTLGVLALATLPLLAFLDAAVSIDAPVFVAVARQIAAQPLDPYGFELMWDPTSPRVAVFNHNPPLLSYWLAPVVALTGDAEWALHAALLPFPAIAGLCFLGIARRLAGAALAPAALLLCAPAFLLLATTLLLDVPMLAWLLLSVHALLRANESGDAEVGSGAPRARAARIGWECAAGLAAAAAGLTKYVGFSAVPLLAAGLLLLPSRVPGGPGRWLRVVGLPLGGLAAWGAWTLHLYGHVHFLGGLSLVGDKSFAARALANQVLSVPVYYGAALGFPILVWLARLRPSARGTELAVAGAVAGAAVMALVLPEGTPLRRAPLDPEEAVLGTLGFAGAVVVWGQGACRALAAGGGEDRFLLTWLGGFLCFSLFVNWHVNAADALLAAPPALLLLFRHDTRPSPRTAGLWVALLLPLSLLLVVSDVRQRDVYRDAARAIAQQIGDAPGTRWSVGQWGFQHYLAREGFRPVPAPQHGGAPELRVGDWLASARNVSQLDVKGVLARYGVAPIRHWRFEASLPLRTTNPDAGGGFYSHQSGFVPFSWSRAPLEEVGLARITAAPRSLREPAPGGAGPRGAPAPGP